MASASPSIITNPPWHIQQVQPAHKTTPTSTTLSIVDSTVVTYAATSALWAYEWSEQQPSASGAPPSSLVEALSTTLDAYPQFAGRLWLTPWPSQGPHAVPHGQRFRRSVVDYGRPEDPGVEVQTVSVGLPLHQLVPPDRPTRTGWYWMAREGDEDAVDFTERFSPIGPLAGGLGGPTPPETPAMRIRITFLSDQGMAIGAQLAHPLGDAQTLVSFMRAWGANHMTLRGLHAPSLPVPVFDPPLLDGCARGDIDAPHPDMKLVEQSKNMPLPWYDWWAHEPGNPAALDLNAQVQIPDEIPRDLVEARRRGQRIPWNEWDGMASVRHSMVALTADELDRLYAMATTAARKEAKDQSLVISRHDVVLAFIWQLINLARQPDLVKLTGGGEKLATMPVALDTTIGLRPRLGLPVSFVGSPVLQVGMSLPLEHVTGTRSPSLGTHSNDPVTPLSASTDPAVIDPVALAHSALALRAHLARFDGATLGAWLHEMAYELAPQRWWNGFLGTRHVMATSWVRSGMWEVDFGFAPTPDNDARPGALRWTGVLGPLLDGLVTVTEGDLGGGSAARAEWWRRGVVVDVKLESAAMRRFEVLLMRWRNPD